jgi:cell division protein FtsX
VDSVAADTGWHRKLRGLLRAATVAGMLAAGLVAALLALVVPALVRLRLTASSEFVRALRLVGADIGFTVRPFAYAGAPTLGLGMLVDAVLTWAMVAAATAPAAEQERSTAPRSSCGSTGAPRRPARIELGTAPRHFNKMYFFNNL